MFGRIISIIDNKVIVKLDIDVYKYANLIGKNVVFSDNSNKIIGEILTIDGELCTISVVGEIINNNFIYGDINKPSFSSSCNFITREELDIMFNFDGQNNLVVGHSYIYNSYPIKIDVNTFFANHFAILGNSGSGKSYSVAKIFQSIFYDAKALPFKTNIFLFDAYGEYQQAFNKIGENNANINYKVLTTDLESSDYEVVKIPFWLLGVDDICLLLNITNQMQIPIIEKALKFVSFFASEESLVLKGKNDIIARALLEIVFSGKNPSEIRNKLVSVLTKYNTSKLNLEVILTKGGWSRTIRQCLFVDGEQKFADIELVISYLESLLLEDIELSLPDGSCKYTIHDFLTALEFALISENVMADENAFSYSNILKIRLNALINSDYVKYFEMDEYMSSEDYIRWLLTAPNGGKAQIVNFNINYVDDRFAKTLVKIYSKLLFDYITKLEKRASMPFHIVLEEAHRYVQNDSDVDLIGYNIFERITKEGRKYGIILGLISQRPSEISQTALSQCSNFLIFKMFHPIDLEFIKYIISSSGDIIINKIKTLNPGTCIMYGSAFKMPMIAQMDMPNPTPLSNSCDINATWYVKN